MKAQYIKINQYGNKYYYADKAMTILHREDGPAIEYSDGYKAWYQNDKLHRENGPAVEYTNGSKVWYQNGRAHREDGPAIEHSDGYKAWYIDGKQLTEAEFIKLTSKKPSCSGKIVEVDGIKYKLVEA